MSLPDIPTASLMNLFACTVNESFNIPADVHDFLVSLGVPGSQTDDVFFVPAWSVVVADAFAHHRRTGVATVEVVAVVSWLIDKPDLIDAVWTLHLSLIPRSASDDDLRSLSLVEWCLARYFDHFGSYPMEDSSG